MKQYLDLLKRIAEEVKPLRISSEKLSILFQSAGIDPFIAHAEVGSCRERQRETLEEYDVYDPTRVNFPFYEALIEYIDCIEEYSVLMIFQRAYAIAFDTQTAKDPRLKMNEYRSWTYGWEDVVMGLALALLKVETMYSEKKRPTSPYLRFIKKMEDEYDTPNSFYRAIIRKLIEMTEEQQALATPELPTAEAPAKANASEGDMEKLKRAIQQVLDDKAWHRQGGFTKAYWYAIYRVYELKFQQGISFTAFADLMQSWGLTQTDISDNIKHAAAKNSLSCPIIRWNDMLAQQGTTTAEKKQIQVGQQLLELLK